MRRIRFIGVFLCCAFIANCAARQQPGVLPSLEKEIAGIVDSVSDSVVMVSTEKEEGAFIDTRHSFIFSTRLPGGKEIMKHFRPEDDEKDSGQRRNIASGIIVDPEGHIITLAEVVKKAKEVRVTLPDGGEHEARVVGIDPVKGIALLRIEASDLKPAILGNSDELSVGSAVITVGNAYGLRNSASFGIVSGKGRTLEAAGLPHADMIQVTCSINPGDPGGPLVNSEGEVVGIIFSTYGRRHPGFSVWENRWEDLPFNFGYQRPPVFEAPPAPGITLRDRKAFLEDYDWFVPSDSQGRARDVGDEIWEQYEKAMEAYQEAMGEYGKAMEKALKDYEKAIKERQPGKTEFLVSPGQHVASQGINFVIPINAVRPIIEELIKKGKVSHGWIGLVLEPLPPAMRIQLNLGEDEGVLVRKVLKDTPARAAGMEKWDIILRVNGRKVSEVEDLRSLVSSRKVGDVLNLEILRAGQKKTVKAVIGEKPTGQGQQ